MRIYLAARYARHTEMEKYARILEEHGHTITSRWIRTDHELRSESEQEMNARFADEDVLDIIASDYFLCFNDEDESYTAQPSMGGRHAEFGIAVASWYLRRGNTGIHLGIVGRRTHIFHWLPQVEIYPSFDAWLSYYKGE